MEIAEESFTFSGFRFWTQIGKEGLDCIYRKSEGDFESFFIYRFGGLRELKGLCSQKKKELKGLDEFPNQITKTPRGKKIIFVD